MRRSLSLLLLAMAGCLMNTTYAADDIIEKGAATELEGRRYALLVGVNDYSFFSPLTFCDNDIANLSKTLGHNGFDERDIIVLRDGLKDRHLLPNRNNIVTQLKLLLESVEKNDLVVVAFSGHGVHIKGKSYLCPYDSQLDQPTDTMISLDGVYDMLQNCPASQKVLIVDACRNDPTPSGTRAPSSIEHTNDFTKSLQDHAPPQGTVIFNSCAPNQFSVEDPDFQSGVFMHYVIAGLSGEADRSKDGNKDGKVSLFELYMYSQYETKTFVRNKRRLSQTPVLKGELTGVYELAVVSTDQPELSKPNPGDLGMQTAKPLDKSLEKPVDAAKVAAVAVVDPDATKNILGSHPALKQANQLIADGKYEDAINAFTNVIKLEEDKNILRLALKLRSSAYLSANAAENIVRALSDSQAAGNKYLPVTVRRDQSKLMVGTETVATLKTGQALEVSEVQGDFVAVISVDGNDTITGWIHKTALSDPPKPAPAPVAQVQQNNGNYNNNSGNNYGYDLSDLTPSERAQANRLMKQYDNAATPAAQRRIEQEAQKLEQRVNKRQGGGGFFD